MLLFALDMQGVPLSYYSGFQTATASAVRLRLSLVVRFLYGTLDKDFGFLVCCSAAKWIVIKMHSWVDRFFQNLPETPIPAPSL